MASVAALAMKKIVVLRLEILLQNGVKEGTVPHGAVFGILSSCPERQASMVQDAQVNMGSSLPLQM